MVVVVVVVVGVDIGASFVSSSMLVLIYRRVSMPKGENGEGRTRCRCISDVVVPQLRRGKTESLVVHALL